MRVIDKVRVLELSFVEHPANPMCVVTSVGYLIEESHEED